MSGSTREAEHAKAPGVSKGDSAQAQELAQGASSTGVRGAGQAARRKA